MATPHRNLEASFSPNQPLRENAEILGTWTAILLAGERPGGDPLARELGVASKAMIQVAGKSMLKRVADALLAAPEIRRVVILAQRPSELLAGDTADLAEHPKVSFASSGNGIASSILAVAGSNVAPFPLLVTTADHALLTPEMLGEFLHSTGDCDLAIGVGERARLESRYPGNCRTWLKFSDGHYSGANLFALRNLKVAPALILWEGVEQDRKRALRLFSRFGPRLLFRALTRSIAFDRAIQRAGARLSLRAKPVVLSAPEAAIDVDKIADLKLADAVLAEREGSLRLHDD